MVLTAEEHSPSELERVAEEQAALRRIATLVAAGATESELTAAVTSENGRFFRAHWANTMRWDGDTIRVIGSWSAERGENPSPGLVFPYGGDTITARIVETAAPARVNSAADLQTELAKQLWADFGLQSSVGAPITVDGKVWGVVTASRTQPGDPFPPDAEHQLRDFAALVAQAIVNAESRRETAALIAEQSALRRIATLVAAGRPQAEVLEAVTSEAGPLFGATTVTLVRWEGVHDEVVVVAAWNDPDAVPVAPGLALPPGSGGCDPRAARDRGRPTRRGIVAGARPVFGHRRTGDRQRIAAGCAHRVAARKRSGSRRRRDQTAQLRRSCGAVDRERACPGRAACATRTDRSRGRRDAPATRAQPARRRATAPGFGLARAPARRDNAAVVP